MSTTDPLIQSNAPIALRPSGRGREEISSLRRLSQLQPQDAAVWRRLGYAELASGEAQNAAASYRRAIELEPWNARGHNNLGQALMRLQQRAEAIACYRRATDLDPGHAAAHNNLGIAFYEEGDTEAALESYRRALALDPKLAEAHHNYGNALLRAEQFQEALDCYERALRLKSGSAQIVTGQGDALASLGRHNDALAAYERGLLIDPQSVRLLARASAVLVELKRPFEALTCRERALRHSPQSAAAQNDRAAVLNMLGRFEEALESCGRALELQADFPEALANRAFALRQLHRYEEALAACEQALGPKRDSIAALSTLAEVLMVMGQQQAAGDCMRRILELDPDRAGIRTMLVMSHIPQIPSNLDEVAASRGAFAADLVELDRWLETHPDLEESSVVGRSTPFYLAYQQTCNRDLLTRHGQLCCKLMSRWEKREAMSDGKAAKRVSGTTRVGIVSAHVRDHSVYRALTKGWIDRLDRRRLEVGVVHLGITQDAQTLWAQTHADFFLDGVRSLPQWVEAILFRDSAAIGSLERFLDGLQCAADSNSSIRVK
jgi:tetratricopeptide (TPR) repeat protein